MTIYSVKDVFTKNANFRICAPKLEADLEGLR